MTSFYKSYFRHFKPEIQGIMESVVPYDFSSAKIHHPDPMKISEFLPFLVKQAVAELTH